MFTKKTVVTRISGSRFSKSFDDLMARGNEMFDAGVKAMEEAIKEASKGEEVSTAVSTTIRIRLTTEQIDDLRVSKTITFKGEGVTVLVEKEPS